MLERAIITTNVDGNLEIIKNNQNGLLVPPKNITKLKSSIITLLEDENLRNQLAKSARKTYITEFNFEKIVKDSLIPLYYGVNEKTKTRKD